MRRPVKRGAFRLVGKPAMLATFGQPAEEPWSSGIKIVATLVADWIHPLLIFHEKEQCRHADENRELEVTNQQEFNHGTPI